VTGRTAANPLGVKGIGEAGTAAAAAAVAAAVCAAVPELTHRVTTLPMTPSNLLAAARGPRPADSCVPASPTSEES
jgi:aerobic carbon-monoxide dehydrogenase large subunit